MASSTPTQGEPAQPPFINSPLPTDSRNDSVTNDESAPLLDTDDTAPPARNTSTKLLYIFTSAALSSSILTLIFIIAATIALNVGENWHGLPWGWSESMIPMIAPVMISSTQGLFCSMCSQASGRILPSLLDVQPCKVTQRPWYSSPRAQHAVRYPRGSLCDLLRSHWAIRHKLRSCDTSEDLGRDSFGYWDHLRVSRPHLIA